MHHTLEYMVFGKTVVRQHTIAFLLLVALPVALVLLFISFMFRSEVLRIAREHLPPTFSLPGV